MSQTILAAMDAIAPLGRAFDRIMNGRCEALAERMLPYLQGCKTVIDLGCGTCHGTHALQQRGLCVTPVDVVDLSRFEDIKPVVYDGEQLPFDDHAFDAAVVVTVLHHAHDPRRVLAEAARVARRVVVIEDVYVNTPHKWITCIADSVMNMEFFGHPHNNASDAAWRRTFSDLGLTVCDSRTDWTAGIMQQITYALRPTPYAAPIGRIPTPIGREHAAHVAQRRGHRTEDRCTNGHHGGEESVHG